MAAATVASPVTLENHQPAHPTAPGNAESVSQPLPDHVPHIEAFVEKLNQEIPHMLAKPQTYDNVLACFITWEDNNYSQIIESAGELRRLLEDEYGYMTEEVKLESSDDELGSDPLRQFNREISAHVDSIGRKTVPSGKKLGNSLFILYYGEHGDYDSSSRKGSWFNRQIKEPSRLEWDSIELIITLATCDVLFLFDCCHATSIVPREIKCRRRCEILGAYGNVEETSAQVKQFYCGIDIKISATNLVCAWTYIDLIRSDEDLLHPVAHLNPSEVVSTTSKAVRTASTEVVQDPAPPSIFTPSAPPTPPPEPMNRQSTFSAGLAPQRFNAKERMRSGPLIEKPRHQSTVNPPIRQDSWFWAGSEQQENPRIERQLRKRRIKDPKV
ncbi:hypothetical protein PFICI_04855 [Pestalotiopsis fici W106-1]|uniref:Uncharacterized protein n=1 Tax=Pestalotiopsis fici (strain W106-1 / CGMCC3.15140) TaxID=1229662 RepID=W3XAC5_PESFW|nr:uncharacterized protein PFICI_04855 [Pestalotiopsis fici W106-1]ETS82979.1 hypothetical protein PFICI_04855 [Pestalotiopsis fici W106-1]